MGVGVNGFERRGWDRNRKKVVWREREVCELIVRGLMWTNWGVVVLYGF